MESITQQSGISEGIDRLVVLVPDQIISEGRMARQVWQLARYHHANLLLIARIDSPDQEPGARRQLATLASLLEDVWHTVSTRVITTPTWTEALRKVVRTGDLIVCHQEQFNSNRQAYISLPSLLKTEFSQPTQVLSGFAVAQAPRRRLFSKSTLIALGFVLIISSFFFFEIRIDQLVKGTFGQILLVLILLVEYSLFWILNNIAN